VYINKHDIKIN
jgi:hypothetical protein